MRDGGIVHGRFVNRPYIRTTLNSTPSNVGANCVRPFLFVSASIGGPSGTPVPTRLFRFVGVGAFDDPFLLVCRFLSRADTSISLCVVILRLVTTKNLYLLSANILRRAQDDKGLSGLFGGQFVNRPYNFLPIPHRSSCSSTRISSSKGGMCTTTFSEWEVGMFLPT